MTDHQLKKREEQRSEIDSNLKSKDYLLVVTQSGHPLFDKQVNPRRMYVYSSLEELPDHINFMKKPFFQHPDLKKDLSNADEVSYEEKEWGIYNNIKIFPLKKELQQEYNAMSESETIDTHRIILEEEIRKGELN